jgi:hypothetical protein
VQALPAAGSPPDWPGPADWGVSAYAVSGFQPAQCPGGASTCGGCAAEDGNRACAAFGRAGAPPVACVDGRCAAVEYDPAAPLAPSAAAAPPGRGWFFAAAARDGPAGGAMVLLEAPPAAWWAPLDLLVTAYRQAALCEPGTTGSSDPKGIRTGPAPLADFRGAPEVLALDNSTGPAPAVDYAALVQRGECRACPPGSISMAYAATACAACPPGRFQPASGSEVCIECPASTYQAGAGATDCAACPDWVNATLRGGAVAVTACFAASVVVERVWLVGLRLGVSVAWSLSPSSHAGAADIIAIFFRKLDLDDVRQLAWAYTSAAGLVSISNPSANIAAPCVT